MELQALPSRIGQVRRIVSAQLRYWHLDSSIDRAALGVTELLTNVHRHAQPDKTCTVEIELLLDRLTVSVHDHDPRLPERAGRRAARHLRARARDGRRGQRELGVRPDGESGKVVWFTLPDRPRPAASAARGPDLPRRTRREAGATAPRRSSSAGSTGRAGLHDAPRPVRARLPG